MQRPQELPSSFLRHSRNHAKALLAAGLLLLGPGCTRPTAGYCEVDEVCARDQYCALPEQQCTNGLVLRAILSGDQVVPPTASQITGDFTMVVNDTGTSGHYTLNLNLKQPASTLIKAEILAGSVGQPNQGSIPLAAISLSSLPVTGDLELNNDYLTGLRAGQYYLRVTTSAFPNNGEIRGQIFSLNPADDSGATLHLTGILGGAQETPAIPSPGTGSVTADFIENQAQLTIRYKLAGITGTINGMHVHRGAFNVNGDQIYLLPASATEVQNTFQVGRDQLIPNQSHLFGLLFKSGLTYLNVHTTGFAAGELRAQLLPTPALPFNIPLKPPSGVTPTGSGGEVEFYWSADKSKLAFRLLHTVSAPKAAMIIRPGATAAMNVTIACPALNVASLGLSGAQGYCDVDPVTMTAGTTTALTAGDLLLGTVSIAVTSTQLPAGLGELAGQLTLPKPM
jgi:hypothetical protein